MSRILAGTLVLAALVVPATTQTPTAGNTPVADVRVHGRVVTFDGQPIVGAAIRCEPADEANTARVLREPQTVTDQQGLFSLQLKPPQRDELQPRLLFVAHKGMASVAREIPWQRKNRGHGGSADEEGDDGETWVAPEAAAAAPIEYAAETKLGDIVLAPGHRLFGRVRDAAGKPLAGVKVVAEDLLEQGNSFRSGRHFGFHCSARTDASGIFDLPCALPLAATLTFDAEAHHRQIVAPVAAGSPLEVTMRPSGWIQGRVLDPDGRSIKDALVVVNYELSAGLAPTMLRTGADGSFRTGLLRPGRWRAQASKRDSQRTIQGNSDVFEGPRENFEILVEIDEAEQQQRIPVRVVDKASGKPVVAFKVAAVWEEYANQNPNYLEYRFRWALREAKSGKDGAAEVDGPGKHGTPTGAVRVLAPGHAPVTRKGVEWKEPEPGQAIEPLTIELDPEATVRGTVLDEKTGKPVAGARVHARLHQDPNQGVYDDGQGIPADAATTAADGTFELKGLGEGRWDVLVRDSKRPRCPAQEVELATAEQKTGFTITVPSGATVEGKLAGAPLGHGTRVFLSKLPRQTFGDGNQYYNYYGGADTSGETVDVQPDGSFRFEGISLDNHLLVLRLPSMPRAGGDLFLPIEPFRVRAAGVQRPFDCSEDRPGTIKGRISFPQASAPFDQLVVVARIVSDENQQFFSPFETNFAGPRSFVQPNGDFEVRVGPGNYQLAVVDLATSILLHNETKKIEVPTGGTAERNLAIELARIDIELKAAADQKAVAAVDRVEVRVIGKALKDSGVQFGNNDSYDAGAGLRWPEGQQKLTVALPLGDATFLCRNNVAMLRIDDERWNNQPLGRAELEIALGQGAKTGVVIEVGPPPEIPDPKKDKKEGEQDAAAETKPADDKKG